MNSLQTKRTKSRYFAIDLFCGAGGMTCGLIQAGYYVIAGVDKENQCQQTYTQNVNSDGSGVKFLNFDLFPKSPEHPEGEQILAIQALKGLLEKRGFSAKNGDKLLLAVCAPCQPFTKISQIELTSKRAFEQGRDTNLLVASLGLVQALKPDAIFCENVEGILKKDNILDYFVLQLQGEGYQADVKIINAARFGVPQNRKRTICIGLRKPRMPEIPSCDPASTTPTVEDVIGHLPPIGAGENHPTITNHRARKLSSLNLKRIS